MCANACLCVRLKVCAGGLIRWHVRQRLECVCFLPVLSVSQCCSGALRLTAGGLLPRCVSSLEKRSCWEQRVCTACPIVLLLHFSTSGLQAERPPGTTPLRPLRFTQDRSLGSLRHCYIITLNVECQVWWLQLLVCCPWGISCFNGCHKTLTVTNSLSPGMAVLCKVLIT